MNDTEIIELYHRYCGTEFHSSNPNKVYCSEKCKKKSQKKRKSDKLEEKEA